MDGLNFEDNIYTLEQENENIKVTKALKSIELITLDKKLLKQYKHMFSIPKEVLLMFMDARSSRHIALIYKNYIGDVKKEVVLGICLQYIDIAHKLTEIDKQKQLEKEDTCYQDTLKMVKNEKGDIVADNVKLRKELRTLKEKLEKITSECINVETTNKELTSLIFELNRLYGTIKTMVLKQKVTTKTVTNHNYKLSVTADTTETIYFNTGAGLSLVAKKLRNGLGCGDVFIHETFTLQNVKEDFGTMSRTNSYDKQNYVSIDIIRQMVNNDMLDKSILEKVENSTAEVKLTNNKGSYTITTETKINITDFGALDGLLDLPNQGITLSLNNPIYTRAKYKIATTSNGISFNAYIHDRRIKKLYTNVGGELVTIGVIHNVDEVERVDILLSKNGMLGVVNTLSIEEIEVNGIYYNKDKALLFKKDLGTGDVKERLALSNHELVVKKQQLEEERIKADNDYKKLKEELELSKAELEKEKIKKDTEYRERKDQREFKQEKRNSWKDMIGIAASFVGLLTSAMVLTSKYILPYI